MLTSFLLGTVFGPLLAAAVVRWGGLWFFAREQLSTLGVVVNRGRLFTLFLCESIFHSTPWLLATVLFIAYNVRGEPWASPFFVGVIASVTYMVVILLLAVRKSRQNRGEHANAA